MDKEYKITYLTKKTLSFHTNKTQICDQVKIVLEINHTSKLKGPQEGQASI